MFTIQGEYSANMIRKAFGRPVAEAAADANAPGAGADPSPQKQLEDRRFFVPDVRTEDCSTC